MDLREYLFRHRMTAVEFSKKVDCHRSYISLIMNGKMTPGKRLARDIEKVTNGEVKAEDLLREKE